MVGTASLQRDVSLRCPQVEAGAYKRRAPGLVLLTKDSQPWPSQVFSTSARPHSVIVSLPRNFLNSNCFGVRVCAPFTTKGSVSKSNHFKPLNHSPLCDIPR